jgi:hypothetical protein
MDAVVPSGLDIASASAERSATSAIASVLSAIQKPVLAAAVTSSSLFASLASVESCANAAVTAVFPSNLESTDKVASFWQMASTQGSEQFNGLILAYPL